MSQLPRYSFAHLAEHAPTSDSSQMAGMTRPSGAGINNYSAYAMMQDNLGGLSTYGNRHVPQQNMMASTLNASDFLKNYRIVKNSQPATAPVSWRDSDFTAPIYTEYRNNAPPSEAETLVSPTGGKLVSDSGYGSQTIRSVGNPSSVYNGDVDNPETQNITQQFSRYGLSQVTTDDRPRRRDARSQRAGSTTSTANNLRCLDCPQLTFKTNSELRYVAGVCSLGVDQTLLMQYCLPGSTKHGTRSRSNAICQIVPRQPRDSVLTTTWTATGRASTGSTRVMHLSINVLSTRARTRTRRGRGQTTSGSI